MGFQHGSQLAAAAHLRQAKIKANFIKYVVEYLLPDFAPEVLSEAPGSAYILREIVQQITLEIGEGDRSMLMPQTRPRGVLAELLADAVAELKESLGDDMTTWDWGRMHRTEPRHPLSEVFAEAAEFLDPPSLPIHGDGDTPLAGGYGIRNEFVATSVSVNRYIHDPSDWTNSRWIVPLGASGHPASPHYADQAETWANVEYIPQLWDWDQIPSEAESHQRLEPQSP